MKARNLIAMLLCAVMAFSVCDVSGSTVQGSQTRSQKQAKVEFPQGWDQGWFNNGAAQYCMTSCIGSDISCTINVYGDGLQFYFEANGLKGKNFKTKIGDTVIATNCNEYGEIIASVKSWPQAESIANILSAGDVPVVLVVDGNEYRLQPESQVAMRSFPQALKWIKSINDAAEM